MKKVVFYIAIFLGLSSSLTLGISNYLIERTIKESILPQEPITSLVANQEKVISMYKEGKFSEEQMVELLIVTKEHTQSSYDFSVSMAKLSNSLIQLSLVLFFGQFIFWGLYMRETKQKPNKLSQQDAASGASA